MSAAMSTPLEDWWSPPGDVPYLVIQGTKDQSAPVANGHLLKEELGDRWLRPDLFRFGASSLLTDIERQLEHFVTGRYSAGYRHPAS